MWGEGYKKARSCEGSSKVFWMWGRKTQKMGVSKEEERRKERGNGATAQSMGEGEGAQWSEGAAPKGSSNVHRGMDYIQRSSDICGV